MSWHKASLNPSVVWIGWSFNLDLMTVARDSSKLARSRDLLLLLLDSRNCSVTQPEKLTGKLLWLSSLFRTFRAYLSPLYLDQHTPVPSMSAVSPDIWQRLRESLSTDLKVSKPLPLAALPIGCKLLRVGHTPVRALADVPEFPSTFRIWIQVSNPARQERQLSESSLEVCRMWRSITSSGDDFRTALLSPLFACEAYADACASASSAAWGVSSVCLTVGSAASQPTSHRRHCTKCSIASRPMQTLNISSPRGSCLPTSRSSSV